MASKRRPLSCHSARSAWVAVVPRNTVTRVGRQLSQAAHSHADVHHALRHQLFVGDVVPGEAGTGHLARFVGLEEWPGRLQYGYSVIGSPLEQGAEVVAVGVQCSAVVAG